jgi:hypothetical protein
MISDEECLEFTWERKRTSEESGSPTKKLV